MGDAPAFGSRHVVGGGPIHVDHRSPSCSRTRLVGRFDLPFAERFIEVVDGWAGDRAALVAFHDLAQLEDYDIDARERVGAWSKTRIKGLDAAHLFVQSRAVAVGLRLLSMVVGAKLVTHHDRARFEAAAGRTR
jgi:hypothetical protein